MDDDSMDGSKVKRRSVKELTKQGGKRDGTAKRAKKSMGVALPQKTHSRAEKKQKKLEKQTKKELKKITKGFGKLKANDGKVKAIKQQNDPQMEEKKAEGNERLKESWARAMKELAEMESTSPFHKEILKKCEGHVVPRHPKSSFINWIEEHLHYSRANHFGKLRTLFRNITRHHETLKPRTKTEKRRLEKKRSKVRKQMESQVQKKEGLLDEQTLLKRRMKNMKKKDKLKKKKLENILKKKSGLKIKDKTPMSEEQKDVVIKELKKAKKNKKKAKSLGI